MSNGRIKCFLVQKTDKKKTISYPSSCKDPACTCDKSPYTFEDDVWCRPDTGEEFTREEMPAGAMWFVDAGNYQCAGFDGKCLIVKTPGGEWLVDSTASNCTKKGDKSHRCWCRSGEIPNITVGKDGPTCDAGAGSIMQYAHGRYPAYHGFLRNGYLEEC